MSNDAEMDFVLTELRRVSDAITALTDRVTDLERRMHIPPELMREIEEGEERLRQLREGSR